MAQLFEATLLGKVPDGFAANFAKAAVIDPSLREFLDWPEGASEAEIAALMQKAIEETLQDPGLKESRSEFDSAMQDLWKLTGGSPKKS